MEAALYLRGRAFHHSLTAFHSICSVPSRFPSRRLCRRSSFAYLALILMRHAYTHHREHHHGLVTIPTREKREEKIRGTFPVIRLALLIAADLIFSSASILISRVSYRCCISLQRWQSRKDRNVVVSFLLFQRKYSRAIKTVPPCGGLRAAPINLRLELQRIFLSHKVITFTHKSVPRRRKVVKI